MKMGPKFVFQVQICFLLTILIFFAGEQNFHIFYELLRGADDEEIQRLELNRDPSFYRYLNQVRVLHSIKKAKTVGQLSKLQT